MEHLSGLDAAFLHLETPEMPMHVGGLNLFDLAPGYGGDFYEDVKAHVAGRMHLARIFTKKLALMPLDLADPVWVEDGAVDLDYHVRKISLPRPGTMAQLEAYVGRLHSSLLDRSRPLWEFYVFEGLNTGQAAFYSKIHHAALDGQGAAALAQAILDVTPKPRKVDAPAARTALPYQPALGEMVGAAARNTLLQCWKLVKAVPQALQVAASAIIPAKGEDGKRRIGLSGWNRFSGFGLAPKTPFNAAITNQRVFATLTVPLEQAKQVAKAIDGTLNDVVMAICSGALRRYLAEKHVLPRRPLVAAVPVNLRPDGNTELNNQVSMMLVGLATNQTDPKTRMREIVKASRKMKTTLGNLKSIMPTDFPSLGVPWLMGALVALYGRSRLADRIPQVANVIISNVPGPQVPLYMAGARMSTYFPVSIVIHGFALNITVQSYNGMLDFGLIACRRVMPDLREFAGFMADAHQELLATIGPVATRSVRSGAAKSKAEAGTARPAAKGKKNTKTIKATSK